MTPTADAERRKAAEGFSDGLARRTAETHNYQFSRQEMTEAFLSGILHGEQRRQAEIVKWLRETAQSRWPGGGNVSGMLIEVVETLATEIERGSKP